MRSIKTGMIVAKNTVRENGVNSYCDGCPCMYVGLSVDGEYVVGCMVGIVLNKLIQCCWLFSVLVVVIVVVVELRGHCLLHLFISSSHQHNVVMFVI